MMAEIQQILKRVYEKVQETSVSVTNDTQEMSTMSKVALYSTGVFYIGGAAYLVYVVIRLVWNSLFYYGSFLFPPKEQDLFETSTRSSKTKQTPSSHKKSKPKKRHSKIEESTEDDQEEVTSSLNNQSVSTQGKSIKTLLKDAKQHSGKQNGQTADKGLTHECYLNTFKGHSDTVTGLSISNEGNTIVTCCEDRYVRFYSLNTSKLDQPPSFIRVSINKIPLAITFGKTYSDIAVLVQGDSMYPDLVIYKLKGSQLEEVKKLQQIHGKKEVIQLLAASSQSPVSYYVTCSKDRDFHVISSTGSIIQSINVGAMLNHNVAISRDGKFIAVAGYTSDVKVWEVVPTQDKTTVSKVVKAMDLGGHKGQIMCVSFSPDNSQCVTVGKDGEIRIWNIRVRYQQQEDAKLAFKFNADLQKPSFYQRVLFGFGYLALIANDNAVWIYKTDNGQIFNIIPKIHSKPITSTQLLYKEIPDQYVNQIAKKISVFATSSLDNQVRLWKLPAID